MDTDSKYMIKYYVVQIFSVRHIYSQGVNQNKIQGCNDPSFFPGLTPWDGKSSPTVNVMQFVFTAIRYTLSCYKKNPKTPVWADCGCAWTQNRQELIFHKQYKPYNGVCMKCGSTDDH